MPSARLPNTVRELVATRAGLRCEYCRSPSDCSNSPFSVEHTVRLFHPRRHQWSDHFTWTADYTQILGHFAIGRATVAKLKLHRPELVKLRRILRAAGEPSPG